MNDLSRDLQASSNTRSTCVLKGTDVYGDTGTGTSYSDLLTLQKFQSPNFRYRLTGVSICGNEDGDFVGLEAFVG